MIYDRIYECKIFPLFQISKVIILQNQNAVIRFKGMTIFGGTQSKEYRLIVKYSHIFDIYTCLCMYACLPLNWQPLRFES